MPREERTPSPKRRHITATDRADAEHLRAILLEGPKQHIEPLLARFLADKREEWIACAMVRAERMYQLKARTVPKGMPSGPIAEEPKR